MQEPQILIVDFGSQYTLLIARALRECGFRSVVLSPAKASVWAEHNVPQSVIFSGGDKSIHDEGAPVPPQNILALDVPTLGICYGMQWLAEHLGGTVELSAGDVEYGPAHVVLTDTEDLFAGLEESQDIWASHGDSVTALPESVEILATSSEDTDSIRALRVRDQKIWGVQFHPEVPHTVCGKKILTNFVANICGCMPDWEPENIVEDSRAQMRKDENTRAILGFSGGVDSTTMAAILAPVLGERLHGICIDAGHLRAGERAEIESHARDAGISLEIVDVQEAFLTKISQTTDAEAKRAAFKEVYLEVLGKACKEFSATHIVQGTLATDLIESGATGGVVIKSHHNVGLDWGALGELAPLAPFFKYEVRALAQEIGLPDTVVNREPLPGPGLFLRIFGTPVTAEKLDLVRWADAEVRSILAGAKDVPEVTQLIVALCGVNTTGVKGDGRAYGPAIVIRGVRTTDFMTADAVEFPVAVRRAVTRELTKHEGIVRVWWDENPKPPATTEFE